MDTRNAAIAVGIALLVVFAGCATQSGDTGTTSVETTTADATETPPERSSDAESDGNDSADLPEPSPATELRVDTRASAWDDARTVIGNVTRFTATTPQLDGGERGVWVYVPPGYDDGDDRYPVVYMQDGQNLFDEVSAYKGEWGVDETMERLAANDTEAMVVGVEHGGANRTDEYVPWAFADGQEGGDADAYAAFLAETLKPTIDRQFRTRPDETAVLGSSLGGAVAVYTAFEYPDRFQHAGSLSTGMPTTEEFFAYVNESDPGPERVFLSWGTDEGDRPEAFARLNRKLASLVAETGYERGETLAAVEIAGGEHGEASWRETFPDAVRFLLTGESPDA